MPLARVIFKKKEKTRLPTFCAPFFFKKTRTAPYATDAGASPECAARKFRFFQIKASKDTAYPASGLLLRKKADFAAHKKLIYSILKSARTHVCILLVAGLSVGLQAQHPDDLDYSFTEVDQLLEQAARNPNLARRIELARRGLLIARDMRYDNGIVQAAVMLGADYKSLNKIDEALQYFLEAEFRLGSSTPKPLQMKVYQSLGELFLSERLYLNARRYYGEALMLEPNNEIILEKIADACLYDMRFDSAEYYYKKNAGAKQRKRRSEQLSQDIPKISARLRVQRQFWQKPVLLSAHRGSHRKKTALPRSAPSCTTT